MAKASTAVAEVKTNTAVAIGSFDYGEMSGAGFEGTQTKDLSIPFISILQSNSPQVEENNPPDCKPGQLINTVTNEIVAGDVGVGFIPVHIDHMFSEWKPRDAGGGLVQQHAPDSEIVKANTKEGERVQGKIILPNKNELIETFYVYGLTLDADGKETAGFAVVSFSSTKIKPFRDWRTSMYTIKGRPPLFANRARLKTKKQENDKGRFFNFDIVPFIGTNWKDSLINPVTEGQLLVEAKDFREAILSGVAKAAFETQNATGTEGTDAATNGAAPF